MNVERLAQALIKRFAAAVRRSSSLRMVGNDAERSNFLVVLLMRRKLDSFSWRKVVATLRAGSSFSKRSTVFLTLRSQGGSFRCSVTSKSI
jgi:hypothetical protein